MLILGTRKKCITGSNLKTFMELEYKVSALRSAYLRQLRFAGK